MIDQEESQERHHLNVNSYIGTNAQARTNRSVSNKEDQSNIHLPPSLDSSLVNISTRQIDRDRDR